MIRLVLRIGKLGAGYYDDSNNNDCDSWYSDMAQSLGSVQAASENADTYFIDGEGHCSLGLYYGMQDSNFDEWAGGIIQEQTILKRSSGSAFTFIASLSIGGILMMSALLSKSKSTLFSDSVMNDKSGAHLSGETEIEPKYRNRMLQQMSGHLAPFLPMGK